MPAVALFDSIVCLVHRNRRAQEGRRDRSGILVEQCVQFLPQIVGSPVLFGRFERVHSGAVVVSEGIHEVGRRTEVERVRIPDERHDERHIVPRNSSTRKSLDHVSLNPPCHRADEAVWWWGCIGGTGFQKLCDQCRISSKQSLIRLPHQLYRTRSSVT